ncbi:MAG: NAD(P)-dependent oxidoreductase [Alphaproteobacteria bacterium]|nr:NAD(P)-dependent oxidoreductase [Alphaproteobacteria bacterium]
MKIGLSGTGRMGTAMGLNLMEHGHELAVWNRTSKKTRELVSTGATACDSPADLVAASDLVINIVIDDKAAKAVYEGRNGLLSGDIKGTLFVEMSTLLPETTKALEKKVKAKGGTFLECPVGGSVAPARQGNLLGMAGGSPAAYRKAKPVLEQLCRRVDRVGDVGAGAAMKLAINLPLLTYWEALGEAMSLTEKAGIKGSLAADILADSSGAAKVAPARIPWVMDAVKGKMHKNVAFDIAGAAKDATLMCALAKHFKVDAPAINATRLAYRKAAKGSWGGRDFALLSAWRVLQNKKPKSKRA